MSEDTTTTTEQETVQASIETQPESPETQAVQAEETQEGAQEEQAADTTEDQPNDEEVDEDTLSWATKKGLKITEDTKPLLKMVRESEQRMHQATVKAEALNKAVTSHSQDQGLDETSSMINDLKVMQFYLHNPEAKELDQTMAEIVTAKPYLADDLETVFELAKARTQTTKNVSERQAGKKEALAQVAKAEKAAPPQASATTRQGVKEKTDADIAKMSVAEYQAWKKETGFNPFQA